MDKIPYTAKSGKQQFKPSMTEDEYAETREGYEGFCLACGETQAQVEPDGRRYKCEHCGEPKVYGFEELMVMGLLILKEDE